MPSWDMTAGRIEVESARKKQCFNDFHIHNIASVYYNFVVPMISSC
jgi:hypothetical protein